MSPSPERGATGWRELPLLRALGLVWQSSRLWTVLRVLLIIVQGLVPLAALYLMKLIVDLVAAALAGSAGPDVTGRLLWLIAAAAAVAIVGAAARLAGTLVTEAQGQLVADHITDRLHEQSAAVDLRYYEDARYHDTLHRAQEQALYRPAALVQELALLGHNLVTLVALGGLLFSFRWWVLPLLVLAALPAVFVRWKYSRKTYDWQRRQTAAERWARYFNSVLTGQAFAKELRLFGLGDLFRERFRIVNGRVRRQRLQLIAGRTGFELVAHLATTLAIFGCFAFIGVRTLAGDMTIGDMVMLFGAFQRAQDGFRDTMVALTSLYEHNLFLSDLSEFLQLEPSVREPEHPAPMPRPLRQAITIENVAFRYPGSQRPVLEDVSLEIRAGEHVALVGENGSGKTTLVKLLCRLYDPDAGAIRLDGTDLRQFAVRDLRGEVSAVFQDYARYNLSAEENIWVGDAASPLDRNRVAEAARHTGADEVIRTLPHGYETVLGRQFADGAELSVGEWQKLALARAFLRRASILILDEPTASLDPRAEFEVFQRFHELAAGRTAILISHRLSTVRMADRIYVLERGRIIEAGGHDELVGLGGTYARLFETQARSYR